VDKSETFRGRNRKKKMTRTTSKKKPVQEKVEKASSQKEAFFGRKATPANKLAGESRTVFRAHMKGRPVERILRAEKLERKSVGKRRGGKV